MGGGFTAEGMPVGKSATLGIAVRAFLGGGVAMARLNFLLVGMLVNHFQMALGKTAAATIQWTGLGLMLFWYLIN